jgi:hypothetical protein
MIDYSKAKGLADNYIILDSYEKHELQSNLSRGLLHFGVDRMTLNNCVGTSFDLLNVVEIEIYQFHIPILSDDVYNYSLGGALTYAENPAVPTAIDPDDISSITTAYPQYEFVLTQLYNDGLVSVELKNINTRYMGRKNKNYQFIMKLNYEENMKRYMLNAIKSNNVIVLSPPQILNEGITIELKNPDVPLSLPNDLIYIRSVTEGLLNANAILLFNYTAHGLVANDRIIIEGFVSTDSNFNNWMNKPSGHLVHATNLTADVFCLNKSVISPFALGLGNPLTLSQPIKVLIPKNRILIPMRIRSLMNSQINHLSSSNI